MVERLSQRMWRSVATPVDGASLAAFRVLFGLLMAFGAIRFALSGFVEHQYVEPSFFFKYDGFEWVDVPSRAGIYAHLAITAVAALFVALGLFYRLAIVTFLVSFTLFQLMDVTNYLNHYMLVIWLALIMCFAPAARVFSLDTRLAARRDAPTQRITIARGWVYLIRAQIAVVYIHAALAKATDDWLFHAQPLGIWLRARTGIPLLGPVFAEPATAFFMSWAGFLYDLTIVFFLLSPRTRRYAYVVVLAFHTMTNVLFDIGLFPLIMTIATTLFFDPSWPRALARSIASYAALAAARAGFVRVIPTFHRLASAGSPFAPNAVDHDAPVATPRWQRVAIVSAAALYLTFHAIFPLRTHLVGGNVLWHEVGMRHSWRVMCREKNGSIEYRVVRKSDQRTWVVSPLNYLTWRQMNEMSGQPDLIAQLARHIANDFRDKGLGDVAVYADTWVSLNGRKAAPLIDATLDLAQFRPAFLDASWIRPAPETQPLVVGPMLAAWRNR